MSDLQSTVADDRAAVAEFIARARQVPPGKWNVAPAPRKWSPAQITEHVATAYEISNAALTGSFPGGAAPRLFRPLIRTFFFNVVLRNGHFKPGGKAPAVFQPSATPAAAEILLPRLKTAAESFEAALTARESAGENTVEHPFFGQVGLTEYLRLQVIHAHHHRQQLPAMATV